MDGAQPHWDEHLDAAIEEILSGIRNDMMVRATKIMADTRPEARKVLENNLRILQLLTESISVVSDVGEDLIETWLYGRVIIAG